ncbi:MAG: hypothetical protein NTV43_11250 [Methylococcales bacterium]|nr:hypothetical protein [Methylococcales bacterium]
MSKQQKYRVVWIEDNPQWHINEKKVLNDALSAKGMTLEYLQNISDSDDPGAECLKFLKDQIETEPEKIAGFVLDVLIPIENLSILGIAGVETSGGATTGIEIASNYLLNHSKKTTTKFKFSETPILFFSIAPGLTWKYPWMNQFPCTYIEKEEDGWQEEIKNWVNSLK